MSPRLLGSFQTNVRVLFYLIPLAFIVNAVLRLQSLAYILAVVLFTRMFESVPYWRYHDPLLSFAPQANKMRAAGASER